jgi:hypothetical protein
MNARVTKFNEHHRSWMKHPGDILSAISVGRMPVFSGFTFERYKEDSTFNRDARSQFAVMQ